VQAPNPPPVQAQAALPYEQPADCARIGCSSQGKDRKFVKNKDAKIPYTYKCKGIRKVKSRREGRIETRDCNTNNHLCCGKFFADDNGNNSYKSHRQQYHTPSSFPEFWADLSPFP